MTLMTSSPDFTDWYRMQRRHATAVREGLCTCCARIWRHGDPGPRPVRAVCEWTTPAGNRELLCEVCLGYWQANAAEDPSLAPAALVRL